MTKPVAQRKRPLTLFQARDHLRRAVLALDKVAARYLRCVRDSEPRRVIDDVQLEMTKAERRVHYWRAHVRVLDIAWTLDHATDAELDAHDVRDRLTVDVPLDT